MRKKLFLLFLISLIFCLNTYAAEKSLDFSAAWIAEAPPNAQVMAGYMTISNKTDNALDITAISSASFKKVEMHQSKESDGFAKMQPQKKLTVPARGTLTLKSGGYHLMLIGPKQWFKQGDKITLDFTLSNQSHVTLGIRVKKNAQPSMKCASGKCGAM